MPKDTNFWPINYKDQTLSVVSINSPFQHPWKKADKGRPCRCYTTVTTRVVVRLIWTRLPFSRALPGFDPRLRFTWAPSPRLRNTIVFKRGIKFKINAYADQAKSLDRTVISTKSMLNVIELMMFNTPNKKLDCLPNEGSLKSRAK